MKCECKILLKDFISINAISNLYFRVLIKSMLMDKSREKAHVFSREKDPSLSCFGQHLSVFVFLKYKVIVEFKFRNVLY